MADQEPAAPIRPAGEAGSGTIPGDHIGTTGPATDQFGVKGAPPRTEALGTRGSRGPEGAVSTGDVTEGLPHSGARGDTLDEHTVVPEARHGVDYGAPSGGMASGTPAQQVEEEIEED